MGWLVYLDQRLKSTGSTIYTIESGRYAEPVTILFDLASRTPDLQRQNSNASAPNTKREIHATALPDNAFGSGINISRDGLVAVGYIDNGPFTPFHAHKWTEADGITVLGTLEPANDDTRTSFATSVSGNGSVIVGYSTVGESGMFEHAFYWTESGGMIDLNTGIGAEGYSRAYGVSVDGTVIVGRSDFPPPEGGFFNVRQPFRWTEAGGLASIGGLEPTSRGTARAVSADGSVIVGEATVSVTIGNVQTSQERAFRWTEAGGMENLGVLPGDAQSVALAVSDDGKIVIGISSLSLFAEEAGGRVNYDLERSRAFYWTEETGMRDLNQLLIDAGVDMSGKALVGVTGMTPDGEWIAAETTQPDPEFPELILEPVPVFVSLTETLPPASRLENLSTRGQTLTDDRVLIPGFVIDGSANRQLLIRVVGPKLSEFGVAGPLADPVLTLKRAVGETTVDVATNDDWGNNANAAEIATTTLALGAFDLDGDDASAALLVDLEPGSYTVIAQGVANSTGVVIAEVYDGDSDSSDSRLANISTRGFVGTGENIMIPGYVVSDDSSLRLLVRAVGPTLGGFGVPDTLADPQLRILKDNGEGVFVEVVTNDNWGSVSNPAATTAAAVAAGAFELTEGSKDAAIVVQLLPGVYTVEASGVGGATGNALVEVYALE